MEQERNQIKSQQMVSFRLGNEEFGVDILKVREIVRLQPIAKVPQTSEYVEGVINLRGQVIPVIDIKKKLGLGDLTRDNQTRIIVFGVQEKIVGVLVDRVDKVLRVPEDQIEVPPEIGTAVIREFGYCWAIQSESDPQPHPSSRMSILSFNPARSQVIASMVSSDSASVVSSEDHQPQLYLSRGPMNVSNSSDGTS